MKSLSKLPLRHLRIKFVLVKMLEIHIYGPLKKKFFPKAKFSDDSVLKLPFIKNETLKNLLTRLKISRSNHGEFFVNHKIVINLDEFIPDNARVAIFSQGMFLIDGGLYIKKWE